MKYEPPETSQTFDDALSNRIVRSSMWVGVGFGGARVVSFLSMLVLVRLLDPDAFGLVAVGMTLVAVVSQIQESGLGAALVHGRRHDPRIASSTVLVFSTIAGMALMALTVALAPLYTRLLRVPEATELVQVLALFLALRGLGVAPSAILERELDFRSRTCAELTGGIVQAAVAIACALGGLGAWSLVMGVLAGTACQTALYWAFAPWRPTPSGASRNLLRELLRYGRYVSGTNILVILNTNMDNVAVARALGTGPLGVYSIAWRLAELPVIVIGSIVGRAMFSVYTLLKHDVASVRAAYVQNMQRTMLFALPVTATLGVAAEPIVIGLLGGQWADAVGPLRVLAAFAAIRLLVAPSGELLKGVGRPHLSFISTLAFLVCAVPALLVLVPSHGITGAALAMLIAIACSGSIPLILTFRVLELRPLELARALTRPVACAGLVAAALLAALASVPELRPVAELIVIAVVSTGAFLMGAALLGRPLLLPIWAGLRRR